MRYKGYSQAFPMYVRLSECPSDQTNTHISAIIQARKTQIYHEVCYIFWTNQIYLKCWLPATPATRNRIIENMLKRYTNSVQMYLKGRRGRGKPVSITSGDD